MYEGSQVSAAKTGAKEVQLKIGAPEDQNNGNYTWLDATLAPEADGKPAIRVEIFEQSLDHKRPFTKAMIAELAEELSSVHQDRAAILQTGVMPEAKWYPVPLPEASGIAVKDGMQPGIYLIEAAVSPKSAGKAYLKVFNTKTGERLSEERLTPRSMRHIGHSKEAGKFFRYTSEVTVYEGDWDHQYEARFELWHEPDNGDPNEKLAETARLINGWEQ